MPASDLFDEIFDPAFPATTTTKADSQELNLLIISETIKCDIC